MKLFSFVFVTLFAFSQAHFNLEKYAKVYRDKRAEYLEAKQELVLAEGPYLAARNAYIASTAVLSNAAIPDTNADPHHVTQIGADDGLVDEVHVNDPPEITEPENTRRRLRAKPLKSGNGNETEVDSGESPYPETIDHEHEPDINDGSDDGANADEALTGPDQQSTFYADYLSAREHWLDAKAKVANLEGPYLAAREAYVFAAQTYSNSLLPSGIGHLYEPVFNEDNFRPHIHIHTN